MTMGRDFAARFLSTGTFAALYRCSVAPFRLLLLFLVSATEEVDVIRVGARLVYIQHLAQLVQPCWAVLFETLSNSFCKRNHISGSEWKPFETVLGCIVDYICEGCERLQCRIGAGTIQPEKKPRAAEVSLQSGCQIAGSYPRLRCLFRTRLSRCR